MYHFAIVKKPSASFDQGISSSGLGKPEYDLSVIQHQAYCKALIDCELEVIELESDDAFPDSTFVEDTAIVTEKCAIITRPGHIERRGEEISIAECLRNYRQIYNIEKTGTLDGGDVMQVESHFYIGLSKRTNKEGAKQLTKILNKYGYTASTIRIKNILHLKSGVSYIGNKTLVIMESLKNLKMFSLFRKISVIPIESYAANCVQINDFILIPKGFPDIKRKLQDMSYKIIELEMSEFMKMDGGLSCLSLRF